MRDERITLTFKLTRNTLADAPLVSPEKPKSIGILTNNDILFGSPVPAIDKLKIVSSEEFEDIIREWIAGYCEKKYVKVWKAGGANDKGRDVVAWFNIEGGYDNYQSKHYDHPLAPSDIWKELGKLCYYTFIGDYKLPRKYYFVAPQGVGPKLGDYFQKPDEFKAELLKEWDDKCKGISDTEVLLTIDLIAHIKSIDFSIFTFLDPQELIEQHQQTSYFPARFGGGLKRREPLKTVPAITDAEILLKYVEQLFEAYSDHLKSNIKTMDELNPHSELFNHFNRQRECFYWADALNQFSRDSLPLGNTCFDELKEEIYQGVVDTSNSTHPNGYENIKKTTSEATKINIQSNALLSVSKVQDIIGICHHLANENRLIWVKK